MKYHLPKGTYDILPYGASDSWQLSSIWQRVECVLRETASDYGYQEIRTPIYEYTELFDRGVGDSSDIVSKEMFTFEDRGGRSISLRPEGTSATMRAFIGHRLYQEKPFHKLFYISPMFRYERPQAGRYRQHIQFGAETITPFPANPLQDAEVIDFLWTTYERLGLKDLSLELNTVGDMESRSAFKEALQAYLLPHFEELSLDSQTRFSKNPLRILDSKAPQDQEFIENAPTLLKFLSAPAKDHFSQLCKTLEEIEIPYHINPRIVRGLDYYSHTVFEIKTGAIGAQNAIGGGGRYDGLVSSLGGPDLASVGFGTGIERIIQAMLAQNAFTPSTQAPFLFFLPMGSEAERMCFRLAKELRNESISCELDLRSIKLQNRIQTALKSNALFCAICGTDEISKKMIQLKHLTTHYQEEVPLHCFKKLIQSYWQLQTQEKKT